MNNNNPGPRASSAAPMINTTTNTDRPVRPTAGAKAPARRGGPGKATLGRVKLGAIAFSAVAFVGTLAGVIRATPNTIKAPVAAQPAVVAQTQPLQSPALDQQASPFLNNNDPSLVMPVRPQMPTLRPFTRTRGS
jgi:hypothetical protein